MKKNQKKLTDDKNRYKKIKDTNISKLSGTDLIKFKESLSNLVESTSHKDKDGNDKDIYISVRKAIIEARQPTNTFFIYSQKYILETLFDELRKFPTYSFSLY